MDGILIVNKPQGMTSHDVVDLVRRRFHIKKAGHAGTLDPMATGVLVLLLGKCTKLSNELMASDKEYEGSLTLGSTSDTGDAWGKISLSGDASAISEEQVRSIFAKFTGEIEQTPPMYSSVKVNGRKLYEFARKGVTVEVAARKISITNLEITQLKLPEVSFKLACSKGTYVRQLCVDIGAELGCGAHMTRLVRTRSGQFSINEAVDVEKLRSMSKEDLEKAVKTIQ